MTISKCTMALLFLALAIPACKYSHRYDANGNSQYENKGFGPEELTNMMERSGKADKKNANQGTSTVCTPGLLYCKCGCNEGRTGIVCHCHKM